MAKKKKTKKAGSSAAVPGAGDAKKNAEDAAMALKTSALREEYERGSYAGVRHLAEALTDTDDATERLAETLVERTNVDMVQLGVGIGAFLVAVGVGLVTLTY